MHRVQIGSAEFFLMVGDLTDQAVDAIVNAANSELAGGGGVDGAIHSRGGPSILAECRTLVSLQGHCHPGNAVITRAGELPAEFVIHTVGPRWNGGNAGEEEVLRQCFINSLSLAKERNLKSISFPAISTGAYGFPMSVAASVSIRAVIEVLARESHFSKVGFVLFDQPAYETFHFEFEKLFST